MDNTKIKRCLEVVSSEALYMHVYVKNRCRKPNMCMHLPCLCCAYGYWIRDQFGSNIADI